MLAFLEKFLLGILASLVFYAITGQLKWSGETVRGWRRAAVVLGAGLLALMAAVLADRLQTNASATRDAPVTVGPIRDIGVKETNPAPKPASEPPVSPEDAFIRKYVADDGESGRTGAWTVVFWAVGPNSFPELYVAAENALSERGYAVRPLFRSTLLRDNAAYEELYTGNPALLRRIGIYRDGVLVGKLRSEVSHNSSLDMFTAHLFADLRVISAHSARVEGQFTIDETGAGFSEAAATTAAEHRLADKLKQQLLQAIPSK